jgi:hypothetical protein
VKRISDSSAINRALEKQERETQSIQVVLIPVGNNDINEEHMQCLGRFLGITGQNPGVSIEDQPLPCL